MTREEAERLLALAGDARLSGAGAEEWAERLQPEREHLREAVGWLAGNDRADDAAQLAGAVWRLWIWQGDVGGGRELLGLALDAGGPPTTARAVALYGDGLLAFRQGRQDESRARNEQALEAARAVGDSQTEALALVGLSRVAFRAGEYDRVRELAGQALELVGAAGDRAAEVSPLHMLAAAARLGGDYAEAQRRYRESLELNRELGDSYMTLNELHNLGHVELHRGDVAAAERLFAEAAELRAGTEDVYQTAMGVLNQAALAVARGEPGAADLLAQAEAKLAGAGVVLDPDDQFEVDDLRRKLSA